MNLSKILHKSALYLKKSAPMILTCLSAVGVVGTAVLASRAGIKAREKIGSEAVERYSGEPFTITKREKIRLAWKCYIPTVIVSASTIACIFGTYAITKHQQSVLLSAYIFADNALKEYKRKVKELYGEDAEENIQKALIQEKYDEYDFKVSEEKKLYYENYYGKLFERTAEEFYLACYHFNRNFALRHEAPLNEFYEFLGLPGIPIGDTIGWSFSNGDGYQWVDIETKTVILDDGLECVIIGFTWEPNAEDYLGYSVEQ